MQLVQQSHASLIPSSGWFFLYVLASAAPTDIAAGLDCVMQSGEAATVLDWVGIVVAEVSDATCTTHFPGMTTVTMFSTFCLHKKIVGSDIEGTFIFFFPFGLLIHPW